MDFAQYVTQHYAGQLAVGTHTPTNGRACALEAYHAWRDEPWSDTPDTIWDFRPLNDGPWSSAAVRAQHLGPVIAAYADCTTWPLARQQAVVEQIALRTVREILAELPGLPEPIRQSCRTATTIEAAAAAARAATRSAAAWTAVEAVAWTAEAAARTAEAAARAAASIVVAAWTAAGAAWTAAGAARTAEAAAQAAAAANWAGEAALQDQAPSSGGADAPLIAMCAIFLAARGEGGE